MIEAYLIREEFATALKAIDRLDELVFGDPYLDIERSRVEILAGRPEVAHEHLDRAVSREPGLAYNATWEYLELAIIQEDHVALLGVLKQLDTDFGFFYGSLKGSEDFAKFVASEPGKEWEKWVAEKQD